MTPLPDTKLEEIFDACIQALATPHRAYRAAVHRFLAYLQTDFPQVLQLSELRRDPHLLGWLRALCEQDPPLSSGTRRIYLVVLRRLLRDLASTGHLLQPGLILAEDFPPQPRRSLKPPVQWALSLFRLAFLEKRWSGGAPGSGYFGIINPSEAARARILRLVLQGD